MPIDYESWTDAIDSLERAQGVEADNRERVRDAHNFIDKKNGQWDDELFDALRAGGAPRYTLDKCGPLVDQVAGELQSADFDIKEM